MLCRCPGPVNVTMNEENNQTVDTLPTGAQPLPSPSILKDANFLRALLQNTSLVILVIDINTIEILDASPAACDFFGYNFDDLTHLLFSDLLLEETGQILEYFKQNVLEGGLLLNVKSLSANGANHTIEVFPMLTQLAGKKVYATIIHDVTVRIKAERSYLEYETKFNNLFNNLPLAVITYRIDLNDVGELTELFIEDLNGVAIGLFECNPDQIKGKSLFEIFDDSMMAEIIKITHEAQKQGGPSYWETYIPTANRFMMVAIYQVLPQLFVMLVSDITERKLVDKTHEQKEFEMRNILDSVPGMVCRMRNNGYMEYFNQAFLKYVGMNMEQMLGTGWLRLIHPEDLLLAQQVWNRASHDKENFEVELRLRGVDWVYHWFLCRASLEVDAFGHARNWTGLLVDISDRKQAEASLYKSEENSRLIFEASPDAVLVSSPDGKIRSANRAAVKLFGWKVDELSLKSLETVFDPANPFLGEFWEILNKKRSFKGELTGVYKDGSIFPIDVVSTMFFDVDGVSQISLFIRDMTERKKLENALTERIKELTCLTEVGQLLEKTGVETEEMFRLILAQTVAAFNYPQDGAGVIEIQGKHVVMGSVNESRSNNLSADIFVFGKQQGTLTLYYSEHRTFSLPSKKIMVENLARMMSLWLERTTAELEIRKLTRAVEQSPLSIMITKPDGEIEYINPGFTNWTGYLPHEVIGKRPDILKSGITHASIYKTLWDTICAGQVWQGELCNRKKNGELFWEQTSISPIFDSSGRIIHFLGIKQDITERKRSQQIIADALDFNQKIIESSPIGICIYGPDGQCISANASAAKIVGAEVNALLEQNYHQVKSWRESGLYDAAMQALLLKQPVSIQSHYTSTFGRELWINVIFTVINSMDKTHLLVLFEDDSDRQIAIQHLKISNDKLVTMVSSLERSKQEADFLRRMTELLQICETDQEAYSVIHDHIQTMFEDSNGAFYLYSSQSKSMEQITVWGSGLASEPDFTVNECWALRQNEPIQFLTGEKSVWCSHMKQAFVGTYLDIPIMVAGETPALLHIEWSKLMKALPMSKDLTVILADNISLALTNIHFRQILQKQSVQDPLTGVYNRRYMTETFNRELPRALRKERSVSLIMLDIDHFKRLNDTYGHMAGDHILIRLSEILKASIRDEDVVCRWGGEEFVLFLPDTSFDVAQCRAEMIRSEIASQNFSFEGRLLDKVTVSMGIAVFPQHGSTAAEILEKADQALYLAKRNGRNRVEIA